MSNDLPLVSVIVPVYNDEKYVEEALNSIFYQTYSHLEVIIIDDGSQDCSVDRIEKWMERTQQIKKSSHTFSFFKQENRGDPETINRGLAAARGEFLTILNSDDVYDSRRIEKLINRVLEEQGELAFSAVKGIDARGNSLPIDHPWRTVYEHSLHHLTNVPTVGFQLLSGNLAMSTGNLFFSRNLYHRVGEFKNLKLAHDYDFLLRALLVTEPIFLVEELYFYRLHGNNTISNSNDLVKTEFNEIYREYLFQTFHHAPDNNKAPCHWYWPSAFSLARAKLKLDRGLTDYLTKPNNDHEINSNVQESLQFASSSLEKHGMKKKQKISLITHELSLTGAPKVVADLAIALKKRGYTVNVISLFEGPMRKEFENNQIPLYVLPRLINLGMRVNKPSFTFIRSGCRLLASFILLFKLHKVIVGNTCATGPLISLLSLLNPFYRIIWYIHDSSPPSASLEIKGKMKFLLNLTQYNSRFQRWFGSQNTQEIWQNSNLGGKTVYWSGIPACHSLSKTSPKPMTEILSVGTSSPRKGTHHLIEAFIMGIKEGSIPDDVRLTIIGFDENVNAPHEYVGDLILQVVHSGLKDRIRLVPNLQPQQLESYYQQTDLYVQSSTQECLPLAILKAMSMGLPIVTTDVNGCIEAIENDKTGYVCRSRNSRLLLNSMIKALKNPEKSRTLGLEAQKVFNEKFCLDKNLEAVFQNLDKFLT